MPNTYFKISSENNKELTVYHWEKENPKAVVQLVHGMSEHLGRYDHFASFLVKNGYAVIGHDQRGHGKTAGDIARVGHVADENGNDLLVEDIHQVFLKIKEHYPNVPVFLFGHSMGSFVSRKFSAEHTQLHKGYIYSATGGHPGIKGTVGVKVIELIKLFGNRKRSKLINQLVFGDYNRKYTNRRTIKDWLSRDSKVVDAYMNDPYCMQIFSTQFFLDLANLTMEVNSPALIKHTDLSKPILFFSGTMDPVGEYTKGVNKVVANYTNNGAKDVTLKLYKDGRHEMLNETNKEEVYTDVLEWLNSKNK